MQIIQNNPYRIAGILSNATTKELQKQKSKIKAYTKVGKDLSFDIDFEILDNINRTEETTSTAFSNIEQNQDKVNFSLFWFLKFSPIDESAINYLIAKDHDKAFEVWNKVTDQKKINTSNFSSFNNIGTLLLLGDSKDELKKGIEIKISLIESPVFEEYIHTVADVTFKTDPHKQLSHFVEEIIKQLDGKYSTAEIIALFDSSSSAQSIISKKYTETPIHSIEAATESTKVKRKENPDIAHEHGLELLEKTKEDLALLKSILGEENLQYKLIADTLAKEIMQCSIDYFNKWESSKDPSKESLELLHFAVEIAVEQQVKDRINGNIEGIEDFAEAAPVQAEVDFIMEKVGNDLDNPMKAKYFIISCKPKLETIGKHLGDEDDYYLSICDLVVMKAMGILIDAVNRETDRLQYQSDASGLTRVIKESIEVSNLMDGLDMTQKMGIRFDENHNTLLSMNSQVKSNSAGGALAIVFGVVGGFLGFIFTQELRAAAVFFVAGIYIGQFFGNSGN